MIRTMLESQSTAGPLVSAAVIIELTSSPMSWYFTSCLATRAWSWRDAARQVVENVNDRVPICQTCIHSVEPSSVAAFWFAQLG